MNNEAMALHQFVQSLDLNNLNKTILLAYSNQNVQLLNQKVRQLLGLNAQTIQVNDIVMAHNNWQDGEKSICKGEFGVVVSIDSSVEKIENLTFVNLTLCINKQNFRIKAMLDSLLTEKGEIDKEKIKNLKHQRMRVNETYRTSELNADDPYMGALRLRYGYAITCHKAQGSEWDTVFIHPKFSNANHRWLYTAVTRARNEVKSWWY